MNYSHTHVSRADGSPAMVVRERKGMLRLMNEDGYQWSDPASWWIPIGEETPADFARWAALDENEEDDYPPSQSGAEFMAAYYNSDSYINYLNRG